MAAGEIIDVDLAPREAWRAGWLRWRRFAVPALGCVLIIAAVLSTIGWTYLKNRADALALAGDLVANLQLRVQGEVESYLAPAEDAVSVLAALLAEDDSRPVEPERIEAVGAHLLAQQDQFAAVLVGRPDGRFLMVRRSATGSYDTKTIDFPGGTKTSNWYRRDAGGKVVGTEPVPNDAYDPRERPWFKGATGTDSTFWTDAYVFFTERRPGVTVARAAPGAPGSARPVAGIDLSLQSLSTFIRSIRIGQRGSAMILDSDGRLIAFPDPSRLVVEVEGQLRAAYVEELGDPLLTRAWDRIRVQRDGVLTMDYAGERWLVSASPLKQVGGRAWTLAFIVPESDFVGFVGTNSRMALLMAAGVGVLAVGLALVLARQWMLADGNARRLADRETALGAQSRAYAELADDPGLLDPDDAAALEVAVETVARAVGARAVSVWQLRPDDSAMLAIEAYDQEAGSHTEGTEIRRDAYPALFDALLTGEDLEVADTADDPRTGTLHAIYLRPLGVSSLTSTPIRGEHGPIGFLWLQDVDAVGDHAVDALTFARSVANMLALRLARAPRAEPAPPAEIRPLQPADAVADVPTWSGTRLQVSGQPLRSSSIAAERDRLFLREISRRGLSEGQSAAAVFPGVTVMVLRLFDDLALAQGVQGDDARALALANVVGCFERDAERLRIRYVKILTDQVVAAEGFEGDTKDSAERVAEFSLQAQATCTQVMGGMGRRPDFAIGLDTGSVMGSAIGFGGQAYNIWGDGVRLASSLAVTGRRGTIQASESAYDALRDRFVFRRRGAFYVDRVGELTTYVLGGRI